MGESNVLGNSESTSAYLCRVASLSDAEVEEGCSFQEGREARRRF